MRIMTIVLIAAYAIVAGLVLLGGIIYPQVNEWSYWGAGVCGLHALLSLVVVAVKMSDAGKISAWSWHGISALSCVGLLLAHTLTQQRGWLLGAAAFGGFTLLVTLVLVLVLKPDLRKG
jgi:hypothetical protein